MLSSLFKSMCKIYSAITWKKKDSFPLLQTFYSKIDEDLLAEVE